MTPIRLSVDAAADLSEIRAYSIARFGDEVARDYLNGLRRAFALLCEHPQIGMLHTDIEPPIHSLPSGGHRIYYDIAEDGIIVQRILHKAMGARQWLAGEARN